MRSKQRIDIKKVIEGLGRQALELQAYRGAMINRIHAYPNYRHETLKTVLQDSQHYYQQGCAYPEHQDIDPAVLDMIQKVLLAEASLTRIRDKSAQLNALIAPVHALPDEILCLIFDNVVTELSLGCSLHVHTSYTKRNVVPPPIVLASVSRRWRTLTFSTPSLWTHIDLSPLHPRSWSELAIAQSGADNLLITLDCCADTVPESRTLDQLMDVVLPHCDRWEDFAVVAHHCCTLTHVGRLLSVLRAPNLRRLRLSLTGKGPPEDQSIILPHLFQGGTPGLSEVYLYSVGLPWDASTLLSRLTCLDLHWMLNETKLTHSQFRRIVSSCPNLATLILRGLYVDLLPAAAYQPLYVPSLRHFEISGSNVSRMCSLLLMPNIEEIHLANVDEAEFRELMQLFDNPVERTKFPSLRSLRLSDVRTAQLSPGFFEAMANIKQLTIIHSDVARWLHLLRAQQSTDDAGTSVVLPRLRTLTLLDDVNDEMLLAIVTERATLGHPLQRLNVHAGSVNVHYRAFLEEFVKLDGIYFRDH